MEFMTSLQGDHDAHKPSLFELLSEAQLSSLIPPSLRYLLAVATHRHPRYLLRILNSFDELYALLSLLIERHYLSTYSGSFTEHFYGLKRERVLSVRGGEVPRSALGAPEAVRESLRLRRRDVYANLAILVGIPYLKRKLDEGWEVHAAHPELLRQGFRAEDQVGLKAKALQAYKTFLRKVYPTINAGYHFSLLAFHLAYLFDGTKYPSPFLWLVGTRIRRLSGADYKAFAAAEAPLPGKGRPGPTSFFSPRVISDIVWQRVMSGLKLTLPTAIFALKFLEWWHASDFAAQLGRKAREGLELPAPTVSGLPAPAKSGVTFHTEGEKGEKLAADEDAPVAASTLLPVLTVPQPSDSALCPICAGPVVTPTASQAGYVYCYLCIYPWVEGRHEKQEAFMADHEGRWESGAGRDAVTGRRLLGGSGGLRRIMV